MLSNYVSARVKLLVVGNGGLMQPSVILTTDKVNYLFNCGEGTQRMIIEHNRHLKLNKIQSVFFTSPIYENWSGFFGLVLTMAEIKDQITLFGHSQFKDIIKMYEQFLSSAANVQLNHIATDSDQEQVKDLLNDNNFFIRSLSYEKSTAYILLAKDKIGKLLIEKCKQFKVPPGPKFAALKNGETVEIDGRIIKPKDVLGPPEKGTAFVILECSSLDHLKNFFWELDNFIQYLLGKELELVVHMTPKEIAENSQYKKWLKSFDPKTQHLILNEKSEFDLGLLSSTELQIKLNLVDCQFFKMLNEKQGNYYQMSRNDYFENSLVIDNCPNLWSYQIRPRKEDGKQIEILHSNCCKINLEEIRQQICQQPDFTERLKSYHNKIGKSDQSSNEIKFPNVLFLGTGSSSPGKQRNTSAIIINLDPNKSILFDCGESTYIQMSRFFGRDRVSEALANIGAIFVSHYHADHHFGLIKLIKERSNIQKDPVFIIAPYSILSFLKLFSLNFEDLSLYYQGIACESLLFHKTMQSSCSQTKQVLLQRLSLDNLVTVLVPHCFESYGIVITTEKGRKIAYSGDSMYSDSFDDAARNCDLIIHEATMNDDLLEEANSKRHSSISQAIKVGRKIGAKYTLLTHFSQRYGKIAPINLIEDSSFASYIEDHVAISFDFMQVALDDLWKAVKLKHPLGVLFDEEIQRMQNVVTKRNFKRKLLEEAAV